MKTLIFTCIFGALTILGIAQTSEHLTFKGVPIDGKLQEYTAKFEKNGFYISYANQTKDYMGEAAAIIYDVDFAGYKNCLVYVSTLYKADLVYKVVVEFPSKETWSTLSENYFDLKKMLTEKFGQPTDLVEKFDGSIYSDDDGLKIKGVRTERCKYYTIWQTDKGKIKLSIERGDGDSFYRDTYVTLTYIDKINGDKQKAKAIDDL